MKVKTQPCNKCGGSGKMIADDAGRQLREVRLAAGVGLRRLADVMGISAQYLADLELGRRNLSQKLVEDFQQALESVK